MATQHDTTAPACEALAAWDKLFNERENLNGYLDCGRDAEFHQPEGRLPADTVRELATAAVLLEQANCLLDKVNERQSRRPAFDGRRRHPNSPAPIVDPAHDNTVICQFREGPECLRVWNELQDTRARVVRLLDRFPDDAIHDGTLPPDAFPDLMDALIDLGKVEAYLCRAWARSTNEPVPDERGARVG